MNKKTKLTKKILALISTIIIAVFAAFYFFVLPRVVDINRFKSEIENNVREKTSYNLKLANLSGTTTFDLCYEIKTPYANLLDEKNKEIAEAKGVKIKIFIPTLIMKEIRINLIGANALSANIQRDKHGKLNIEKLFAKQGEKQEFKPVFNNSSIDIGKHNIIFDDYFLKKPQEIKLAGSFFRIQDFTPKKTIKVLYKGNIKKNGSAAFVDGYFHLKSPLKKKSLMDNISMKGQVKNLVLSDYFYYFKALYPKLTSVNGKLNVKINFDSNNFKRGSYFVDANFKDVFVRNNSLGSIFSSKGNAHWLLNGNYSPKDLGFKEVSLKGIGYDLTLKGKIENYKTLHKNLDLKINIKKSKVENILAIFPKIVEVKDDFINKMVKYNARGFLHGDISLKGYYRVPLMHGQLSINDFSLLNDSKDVPKSHGHLKFKGRGYDLSIKVWIKKGEFVKLKGSIVPFKDNFINLLISSTEVDLAATERKLLAVQDVIGFPLGPVPEMIIKGRGHIYLLVRDHPTWTDLFGYLIAHNVSIKYSELSKPLTNVNGKLIFDKKKIDYNHMTGFVDGSKVIASGYNTNTGDVNVNIESPNMNLKVAKDLINNSIMLEETAKTLSIIDEIDGQASLKLNLHGKVKTDDNNVSKDSVMGRGEIGISSARVLLDGFSQYADISKGNIAFNEKLVNLKGIQGSIASSPASLNGVINDGNLDLAIKSPRMNLASSLDLLNHSKNLKLAAKMFKEIKWVKGFVVAEIDLKGKVSPENSVQQADLFKRGSFRVINAQFRHALIPTDVTLTSGSANANANKTYFKDVKGFVYNAPFSAEGHFDNTKNGKAIPFYTIKFKNLSANKAKQLVPQNKFLSNFRDLRGLLNIDITQNNKDILGKVNFNNFAAVYMPMEMPVKFHNGTIRLDNHNLSLDALNSQLSQTKLFLNGNVKNFDTNFNVNLEAYSKIASEDIDRYVNPHLSSPVNVKGKLPVYLKFNGNFNNWNLKSKLDLDEKSDISYRKSDFGLDSAKAVNLNLHGNKKSIFIKSFNISQKTERGSLPMITASGIVDNYATAPFYRNLSLVTHIPANVRLLNAFFKQPLFKDGTFESNVTLNGNIKAPSALGYVAFNDVYIPKIQTRINDSKIEFHPNVVNIKDTNIDIANSKNISVSATVDNVFDLPISIKSAQINAQTIDMNRIAQLFSKMNQDNSPIIGQKSDFELPPVVIQNAQVNAGELIVKNLITSGFKTNCTLTPDWILSLNDVTFKAADGNVFGDATYNIRNTNLDTRLNLKNMKANAAASTILNFNNEVYGNLNGSIRFKTHGLTSDELLKNARGRASFEITDGRLVRLGSMEYLLRAGNVLKSGITGLNINNVIDLVAPQKTGYFKELKGSLTMENGILKTNDIASRGENLSLYIIGNWNLTSNKADITILGRLSKNVSSLLGPVGKLSINSVIGILHVKNDTELIKEINKIPGLEINNSDYRLFRVDFNGDYYDINSIKTFKWVEKS